MKRKPTHPGTVFLEDVLKPLNLSITEAAGMLGISRKALSEALHHWEKYIAHKGLTGSSRMPY